MRDVLFLNGRIHHHRLLARRRPVHLHAHREDELRALLADALAKIHQITRVARQLPLEVLKPAQKLPVGILHPLRHHRLIVQIEHLLEQQQRHHQPHRLRGPPLPTVKPRKRLLKRRPRHPLRHLPQRLPRIQLLAQCGHQKRSLSARRWCVFHRSFRPPFPTKS